MRSFSIAMEMNLAQIRRIGNPLANVRGSEPLERGWEHLRIFSYRGLLELLTVHGFQQVRGVGAGYYPFPAETARLDPRHAVFMTVIGTRQSTQNSL